MKKGLKLLILFSIIFVLVIPQTTFASHKKWENHVLSNFHFEKIDNRFFLWAEPTKNISEKNMPVIFLFHGASQHAFSWIIGLNSYSKKQLQFTSNALQEGFFIIALESQRPIRPGPRAWNVFNENTTTNTDFSYLYSVIHWLQKSNFTIDYTTLFGVGFSSGAFMCSRIALSDEKLFAALAINSGCNADSISLTQKGPVFDLKHSYNISNLHPPTLIIHGQKDRIVPVQCSLNYYHDLQANQVSSRLLLDENNGHVWLSLYNDDILSWFKQFI